MADEQATTETKPMMKPDELAAVHAQHRRLWIEIVSAVVLVVGVAFLAVGLSTSSSAGSDRDDAKSALVEAQSTRDQAKADLSAVADDATVTVDKAVEVVPIAEELNAHVEHTVSILKKLRDAFRAGDVAAVEAALDELDTAVEEHNDANTRLNHALGV